MQFLHGQQQTFLGSGREEQLSALFIQIPFWQYSEGCFFSSLPALKLSMGQLEARVYTWLSRVASLKSAEILFQEPFAALLRAPPPASHPR